MVSKDLFIISSIRIKGCTEYERRSNRPRKVFYENSLPAQRFTHQHSLRVALYIVNRAENPQSSNRFFASHFLIDASAMNREQSCAAWLNKMGTIYFPIHWTCVNYIYGKSLVHVVGYFEKQDVVAKSMLLLQAECVQMYEYRNIIESQ